MPTLHTDRLTLRMIRESDLDAYAAMCADPEVMRYLGEGKPFSRAESWRSMALMIGHWQLRGYGLWAVEERQSGNFIGRIGCWNPEGWPGFEIGWTLCREFWGHGYATEGARAAIQYAFTELKQPRIISLIRPENTNSIRVAQRLGETLDGEAEVMGHKTLVYALRSE
jgi:RimJ/RimL family protein N-acetyltransferase